MALLAAMDLTSTLSLITSFIASAVSWGSTVLAEVTSNPVLFIMVLAMPIAGYAIGWLQRLIRL